MTFLAIKNFLKRKYCHQKHSQKGNIAINIFPKKEILLLKTFLKRKYCHQNFSQKGNYPIKNFPKKEILPIKIFLKKEIFPSKPFQKRKFFDISAIKTLPKKEIMYAYLINHSSNKQTIYGNTPISHTQSSSPGYPIDGWKTTFPTVRQ